MGLSAVLVYLRNAVFCHNFKKKFRFNGKGFRAHLVDKRILVLNLYSTRAVPAQGVHCLGYVDGALHLKVPDAEVDGDDGASATGAGTTVYDRGPLRSPRVRASLYQERNHCASVVRNSLVWPTGVPQVCHFTFHVCFQVLEKTQFRSLLSFHCYYTLFALRRQPLFLSCEDQVL